MQKEYIKKFNSMKTDKEKEEIKNLLNLIHIFKSGF